MDALRGADDIRGLEIDRQNRAEKLPHYRRPLQARQLCTQSCALFQSGLESKAHRPLTFAVSTSVEPSRQIGGKPGGSVEGWDDLAHESCMSRPITAERPLQGVGETFHVQFLRVDAPGQTPCREHLCTNLLLKLMCCPRHNDQRAGHGQGLTPAV